MTALRIFRHGEPRQGGRLVAATATALALALVGIDALAQPAPAVPPFDIAYRAWDAVTDIARHNRNAAIGGACSKTFRPFVVPGLRRQSLAEQDSAAIACRDAARAVCADRALQRSADMAKKCEEFR